MNVVSYDLGVQSGPWGCIQCDKSFILDSYIYLTCKKCLICNLLDIIASRYRTKLFKIFSSQNVVSQPLIHNFHV